MTGDTFHVMPDRQFAYLRFVGERYKAEDGIPVEALAELVVYREIVVEVARSMWKRRNPDRKRAPKNWTEKLDLRLDGFTDGSIMPHVVRKSDSTLTEFEDYFDEGRDVVTQAVSAVGKGQKLPSDFPPSGVPKLGRLGRTLGAGDRLYLGHPEDAARRTELNRSTANLLSKIAETMSSEQPNMTVRGRIVEMDAEAESFELRTSDDRRISGRYDSDVADNVKSWLVLDEDEGSTVEVTGIALVDPDGLVQRFLVTEPVVIREVPVEALESIFFALAQLPDVVPAESLRVLTARVGVLTEVFPKVGVAEHSDGILRLEWSRNNSECSVEIEPDGNIYMHRLDVDTGEDSDAEVRSDEAGFLRLDQFIAGGVL